MTTRGTLKAASYCFLIRSIIPYLLVKIWQVKTHLNPLSSFWGPAQDIHCSPMAHSREDCPSGPIMSRYPLTSSDSVVSSGHQFQGYSPKAIHASSVNSFLAPIWPVPVPFKQVVKPSSLKPLPLTPGASIKNPSKVSNFPPITSCVLWLSVFSKLQ